jgi:hypothetical protein
MLAMLDLRFVVALLFESVVCDLRFVIALLFESVV